MGWTLAVSAFSLSLHAVAGSRSLPAKVEVEDHPFQSAEAWLVSEHTEGTSYREYGFFDGVKTLLKGEATSNTTNRFTLFATTDRNKVGPDATWNEDLWKERFLVFETNGDEIYLDWIGAIFSSSPSPLKMSLMIRWVVDLAKARNYTKMTLADWAAGSCSYQEVFKNGEKAIAYFPVGFQSLDFLFTPMYLIKYGQPFYTKNIGAFPTGPEQEYGHDPVEFNPEEFCRMSKLTKDWGDTPLQTVLDAADVETRKSMNIAAAMMGNRAGPDLNETLRFKDIFLDKSVWTRERADLDQCKALAKTSTVLSNWSCGTVDEEHRRQCTEFQKLAEWISKLSKAKYVLYFNEEAQSKNKCSWYNDEGAKARRNSVASVLLSGSASEPSQPVVPLIGGASGVA